MLLVTSSKAPRAWQSQRESNDRRFMYKGCTSNHSHRITTSGKCNMVTLAYLRPPQADTYILKVMNTLYTTRYSFLQQTFKMEITDLVPLIEALDDNIDDLEEALEPLLQSALSDTAGKLPLLDKAQLYVLVTYAIESILFCKSIDTNIIPILNYYSLPPPQRCQF